jgi:hypothetical protein
LSNNVYAGGGIEAGPSVLQRDVEKEEDVNGDCRNQEESGASEDEGMGGKGNAEFPPEERERTEESDGTDEEESEVRCFFRISIRHFMLSPD